MLMTFYAALFVSMFPLCYCDWVSDWLYPVRDQFGESSGRRMSKTNAIDGEKLKMFPSISEMLEIPKNNILLQSASNITTSPVSRQSTNLMSTLETLLSNAKQLANSIKSQILIVEQREEMLKDAIVNGRSGMTTVTVSTLKRLPREYIIRDGEWTLCNGIVQHPTAPERATAAAFSELYSVPRCIGHEVTSKPDPCVFNSVIKYDTIPAQKRSEYSEEEYLCLKPTFNTTLEQYFSVTKHVVERTCHNGIVRSLADNISECGLRVLSDYTFYPNRHTLALYLPVEYCDGGHGSCKLIVAWHLSNSSVENFEFIKDDPNFKNYFIKSGIPINNAMY